MQSATPANGEGDSWMPPADVYSGFQDFDAPVPNNKDCPNLSFNPVVQDGMAQEQEVQGGQVQEQVVEGGLVKEQVVQGGLVQTKSLDDKRYLRHQLHERRTDESRAAHEAVLLKQWRESHGENAAFYLHQLVKNLKCGEAVPDPRGGFCMKLDCNGLSFEGVGLSKKLTKQAAAHKAMVSLYSAPDVSSLDPMQSYDPRKDPQLVRTSHRNKKFKRYATSSFSSSSSVDQQSQATTLLHPQTTTQGVVCKDLSVQKEQLEKKEGGSDLSGLLPVSPQGLLHSLSRGAVTYSVVQGGPDVRVPPGGREECLPDPPTVTIDCTEETETDLTPDGLVASSTVFCGEELGRSATVSSGEGFGDSNMAASSDNIPGTIEMEEMNGGNNSVCQSQYLHSQISGDQNIISRGVKKPEIRRIPYIISASVGDQKFEGSGSTYKVAKNAAAVVALKALFNLDFEPDPNHKEGRFQFVGDMVYLKSILPPKTRLQKKMKNIKKVEMNANNSVVVSIASPITTKLPLPVPSKVAPAPPPTTITHPVTPSLPPLAPGQDHPVQILSSVYPTANYIIKKLAGVNAWELPYHGSLNIGGCAVEARGSNHSEAKRAVAEAALTAIEAMSVVGERLRSLRAKRLGKKQQRPKGRVNQSQSMMAWNPQQHHQSATYLTTNLAGGHQHQSSFSTGLQGSNYMGGQPKSGFMQQYSFENSVQQFMGSPQQSMLMGLPQQSMLMGSSPQSMLMGSSPQQSFMGESMLLGGPKQSTFTGPGNGGGGGGGGQKSKSAPQRRTSLIGGGVSRHATSSPYKRTDKIIGSMSRPY